MIPSLLQIPSAVSDSKLHSVLPNNGKGDFQFDRSTGATRINRDGLIEEVGYFSSELVQNGDFSELGSELVTNGDFADNSWWQLSSSNVNISNGRGNFTAGTTEYFYKTNTLTVGKTYKIVFEITDQTTGYITAFGGSFGAAAVGVGTYIRYYTAVDTTFGLVGNTFVGSIDNVSVKQVDPNDRWTKSNGSTISEDVATVVALGNLEAGSSNWTLYQTVFEQNKTYKVTFKARQKSGSGTFQAGRDYYFFIDEVITSTFTEYSFIIDSGSLNFTGHLTFGGRTSGNEFEVDNVSVVEVQGDRPRLSYDITNGVVEDKPHLLLENSSTNLVTFSEDFSQWTKQNITDTANATTSPDGANNGTQLTNTTTSSNYVYKQVTLSTSTAYSISVFVKKGTSNIARLDTWDTTGSTQASIQFNLDTEAISVTTGTASFKKYPNDWYRLKVSFTSSGSLGTTFYRIFNSDGVNGSYIYIFGATLEQQAYCTSYIPTAGTTITRAAETCEKSNLTNHIGQTEGTVYCEVDFKSRPEAGSPIIGLVTLNNDVANLQNCILLGIERQSGGINRFYPIVQVGNSTVASIIGSTLTDGNYKAAFTYRQNDFSLYVNGDKIGVDTSGAVPTTSQVLLGRRFTTDSFILGDGIKGVALYNQVLSESQLMQLTGVTASSIYNNFVTRTASFTVEALNEVKKVIDNL